MALAHIVRREVRRQSWKRVAFKSASLSLIPISLPICGAELARHMDKLLSDPAVRVAYGVLLPADFGSRAFLQVKSESAYPVLAGNLLRL